MKILILGGSGFIGSHVAEALSKYNHSVVIYDLKKPEYLKNKYKFVNGSINNYKKLDKAIKGSDIIFNFAAQAGVRIHPGPVWSDGTPAAVGKDGNAHVIHVGHV